MKFVKVTQTLSCLVSIPGDVTDDEALQMVMRDYVEDRLLLNPSDTTPCVDFSLIK